MTSYALPNKIEVQQMLGMLYDTEVSVEESTPLEDLGGDKRMYATFINDEDGLVTLCVCDFGFAAFAGGALTKIPKPGVEEALETGEFSPMLLSNLNEVMNICSRLFMNSNTPHLRLEKTYQPTEDKPAGFENVIAANDDGKCGFAVNIDGYGAGNLTFVAT